MKKKPVIKKVYPVAWIPVVFALLLCFNTIPNKFCLDDYCVIVNNDYVHAGVRGIPEILKTNYFNGFNRFNDGLYRPVPMITFALETSFFGMDTGPRHVTNILLYALTGLFLFFFLRRLFSGINVLLPLSITLLYLAHPIHTEAIANIKGRDELLAFLFSILAAGQILRFSEDGKYYRLVSGLVFFLLGLLSKENAVTFLVVIPLAIAFFRKIHWKKYVIIILPLAGVSLIWLLWRQHVISSMSVPVDKGIFTAFNNSLLSSDDHLVRICTGLYLQVLYIWKMIIPYPLSHDYSFNQIPVAPVSSIRSILSIVALASVCFLAIFMLKRNKAITFSILLFFITIAPVANIFIYIGATFAERFLFTPSLGFAILSGFVLFLLVKKNASSDSLSKILLGNKNYSLVLAGILVVYSILFINRNTDWQDNYTLYAADVSHSPNSARAHYNYGSELFIQARQQPSPEHQQKLQDLAVAELQKALTIYPEYSDALNNMGNVWEARNNLDSSNFYYLKILSYDSLYLKCYFNLGLNYFKMQQPAKSIPYLEKLIRFQPENAKALYILGNNYGALGKFDQAVRYLEKCVNIDEKTADALLLLGKAYGSVKEFDRASKIFNRILQQEPDNFEANLSLAISYRMMNMCSTAIEFLLKCEKQQPSNPSVFSEMMQCYQVLGDIKKAEESRKKYNQFSGKLG